MDFIRRYWIRKENSESDGEGHSHTHAHDENDNDNDGEDSDDDSDTVNFLVRAPAVTHSCLPSGRESISACQCLSQRMLPLQRWARVRVRALALLPSLIQSLLQRSKRNRWQKVHRTAN